MNLMLLCAGEGSRLRPYTAQRVKPELPFLTVPLAAYSLHWMSEVGLDRLCVNTFYLRDRTKALFHRLPHGARQLIFSDEIPRLKGSGGGLAQAQNFFRGGGDFLMMNGDEVFLPSTRGQLKAAVQTHQQNQALMTIVVMKHPEVGSKFGGVWADSNNRVLGFGRKPIPGAQMGWHYIGTLILSQRLLPYLRPQGESNIFYDIAVEAIQKGERVHVFPVDGFWHETGNPQDFLEGTEAALEILEKQTAPAHELQRILDRFSSGWKFQRRPQGRILQASGAKLAASAAIQDFLVQGPDSVVEDDAHLTKVILEANAKALAGSSHQSKMILA